MQFKISDPALILVAMIAVVGFAIAVFVIVARRVSRTKSPAVGRTSGSGANSEGVERPNRDVRYILVRERVETYRDESLYYQLGLERHRRNASRDVLLELLAGHKQVMSRPILYLNSDDWKWDQQQLQDAVIRTLTELDLPVPTDGREPTAQAERACDDWAVAEARKHYDKILGSDAQARAERS